MSGKAVAVADNVLSEGQRPPHPETPHLTVAGKQDDTRRMKAVCWEGKHHVKVREVPMPLVTDPTDAVIRVTSTAICGSDLHLFEHTMPGMRAGNVLGHEFMGVVQEVGDEVKHLKPGDRVVCCFDIGCGTCYFCRHQLFSSCASSNPSRVQEAMYGQPTGGFFGYSHLTGGWQGGQADYVRVPAADVNCLKVPSSLSDDKVLFLSDILPTAWHGCEMGEVGEGDVVAIWGAGPVGILTAHCAQHRGAKRVILVDSLAYRLAFAKEKVPGIEAIDRNDVSSVPSAIMELVSNEPAGAPDVVIDCVGQHYATSLVHKAQMTLQLETDTPEIVNEAIKTVRKGGRISVIGAYAGFANGFSLGPFMEKQLTMRGGQTPVQRYWKNLLSKIEAGVLHPEIVITHHLPIDKAAVGYDVFNAKRDHCVKVVLQPGDVSPAGVPQQKGEAVAV